MSDPRTNECGPPTDDDGRFDEVREAAGAVLASLKWLVEATERVIEDPEALAAVAVSGRSFVDAFTRGFRFNDRPDGTDGPGSDR